ncbi:MAG: MFS transporter [Elusimicrobia bacterium]|nr:MFS transporter [Elusimicrobiota bacterium]
MRRLLAALLSCALAASGAPAWAGPVSVVTTRPVVAPLPAFAPAMTQAAAAPVLSAPVLGSAPVLVAAPSLAPSARPTASMPAAVAAAALSVALPAAIAADLRFRPAKTETAPAAPRRNLPAAKTQAAALVPQAGAPAKSGPAVLAGRVFDGSGLGRRGAGTDAVLALGRGAQPRGRLAASGVAEPEARPEPVEPELAPKPLPLGYKLFLGGLALSSIGQAVSTVLIPLMSHGIGPASISLSQAIGLAAVIPGGWLGAWWVKRFGPKSAYIWSNVALAAMFVSLPLSHAFLGPVSTLHLAAFSALGGMQYGMLRGIAEQDITVRILGQGDRDLLARAGALYYLVVAPVYMATSMAFGALLSPATVGAFAVVAGLAMVASTLPFRAIKADAPQEAARPGKAEDAKDGGLPLAAFMPYLFFWSMHYAFYFLLSPFFALEVFRDPSLSGWFVGLYSLGSLSFSLLKVFAPKLVGALPVRVLSIAGVVAVAAFLWSVLGLGSPALALASVYLMGLGVAAGMILWKALYLNRLSEERQVAAFGRINTASVVLNLLPLALIYGAGWLAPGTSIPLLLSLVAGAATLAGAALTVYLARGARSLF